MKARKGERRKGRGEGESGRCREAERDRQAEGYANRYRKGYSRWGPE